MRPIRAAMQPRFNAVLRRTMLASRWCMAPLALGLIAALLLVIAQFFRDLAFAMAGFSAMGTGDVIFAVLKLVDLMLVATLVLMIRGAGVEFFLPAPAEGDRPSGSGIVEFAALKPRDRKSKRLNSSHRT